MKIGQPEKIKAYLKLVVLILLVVGIPVLIYFCLPTVSYYLKNIEEFDALLEQNAAKGVLIYLAAQALQVIVAILPGEVVQIAGGYVYGVFWGVVLSLIGIAIGSFFTFRLSRLLGKDAVSFFVSKEKLAKFEHYFLGKKGGLIVFLLFLIPGTPKDILVYAAGLSGVDEKRFYILSMLGRIPAIIGSMYMGSLLQGRNFTTFIIFAAIVCIIFIVCVIYREKLFTLANRLKDKHSHKNSEDE